MKKSIFLFFAAILCSMSIDAYAATQRYIYVGLSNNYHKWKNASQWGINHWGGTGGGVVPGSKITDLKTTITHSGCTFHMYRMYVYDDNKNFEFKGSDNWWDCKKENISISGTTKNALLFRDNDGGDGGSPTFYQTNYQEESNVSLSVSSNSVSVGEEVILTPTLTSNAEYNEITSTTYSVGTGATVSNGKFVATAAGTYTVTATITYNPKKFTGITKKVENITCEIVVSEVAIPHPVTSVTVAPTSVTIKQGATVTLTATVAPSNADDPSVTWSSDNNSVATVVNGVVTAVAVGTANITVTTVDGGFTATCAVKVKPLQYTFYAINSAEWPTVAAHYWEGADGGSAWPGADMVKESETINGFDIYSITISSDFVNIMFTNQIDGDKNKKTADLTTEGNDGKYYDIKDAKWYASLSEVPVPFDYYVIGTINGWAMGDANYGMKDDNKDGVYEKQITFAAGDHVIKVNDGTWDKQWQFSNLTATYVGVTEGTDDQGNKNGNIAIHLDAETTITIKLNPTKNELTLDGLTIDAPVVTYDYYVVGTINGWGLKDASYGMELSGDVYEKEVAFAIGKHELKINNGTWDNANTFGYDNLSVAYEGVSRGSGDGDNNIVIDLAEAKTIAIKFDNNTKKITLEGLTQIHTVKATVNPAEAGTVKDLAADGKYEHGAEATLTATPAEGYEFVNWTVGGKEVSAKNPYTFTVTADVALVANFVAVDYKDITFTVGKSGFTGVPQIKWWGAKGLEDAAEPVEMTAGQYNRYSYTFSNIDAITGVSFYIVLDGVQSKTITLHETPNTYSQFYTILQEVFVTLEGEIEGVQLEGHPMAGYSRDYTKVNGVVQLPANTTKAFKLTVDGKDKGGNTIALTKDNLTANFTEDGEGNATIATELAGGYLFTYDYITKDVTVVYPFVGTMDLGQMTPSYSDESVTLKDDNNNEVTIYNVVEGEHTFGDNFNIKASVKHNGEWYTLTGKGSWTLADGVMTLVATNLVDENNTVNYTITATALAPQEYTIACNGTYDEEVTEYYSSIKYAATTDEEDVIVIEIGVYGEETSASGQFNDTWFTTLTYTVEEGEDGVKVLTATATDEAGNTYHITITATKLVYPSINIYNATLVEEEEGNVTLTCTYEGVNLTLNYSYAMWAGGYTAELASGDCSVYYSCEAPSLEKDGSNYTITGVFSDENSNKYNVMVTTKANPATSLDNLNSTVAPVKMIENGQLIIVKDGVQYNTQGAVVK